MKDAPRFFDVSINCSLLSKLENLRVKRLIDLLLFKKLVFEVKNLVPIKCLIKLSIVFPYKSPVVCWNS
jgi:hypothetical protein